MRFPQENRDLGMKAGEVVQVEEMDRKTGIITLRKENGEEAKLVPEHTKREMERQKSMEERSPERKMMEQGKEERKEEKKEVSKEREERKEVPEIERQRERGRDGLGY